MSSVDHHVDISDPNPAPTPAETPRHVGTLLRYAAVVAACNTGLWFSASEEAQPVRLVIASVFLWVASVPLGVMLYRRERSIPFFPVISLFYFLYFGLPIFRDTVLVGGHVFDHPVVTDAVLMSTVGVMLMVGVYFSPLRRIAELVPSVKIARFDLQTLTSALVVGAVGSTLVTVLSRSIGTSPTFAAIVFSFSRVPLVFLGGLFLLYLRGQLSGPSRNVGAAAYLVYLLAALGTGAMAAVLLATAPVFFLYVAEKRRVPWVAGLVVVLLALPFMQTKHRFRQALREESLGPVERVTRFIELTVSTVDEQEGSEFAKKATRTSEERTSYLGTLAYVMMQTPRAVPYWDGHTYKLLLWSVVPRVLYPDKPKESYGQTFGHRYGLINRDDYKTAFNMAQLVEMFANFGYWGVWIGMSLMGLLFRIYQRFLGEADNGDAMLMVGAACLPAILNVESSTVMVLFGAPKTVALCVVSVIALRWMASLFGMVAKPEPA